MFIGQNKLISKLNNSSLTDWPHSIILLGDYGCGKHLYCRMISEKFNLDLLDISKTLNSDTIEEIKDNYNPTLYIIDLSTSKLKDESILLKFIEEPLVNSYIIIISESINNLLDTIVNRCQIWHFEEYSKKDLLQFGNTEYLSLKNTPGKILNYPDDKILSEMYNLGVKILEKINTANLANILTLTNKLNFNNNDPNLYDVRLFFDILLECSKDKYIKDNKIEYYNLTKKLLEDSNIFNINKKVLFENYLCNLKSLK